MDLNSDEEIDENREVKRSMVRNRKKRDFVFPPHMIIGIIVMIGLMVVFALFFHGGSNPDPEEMNTIIAKLDQLNRSLPQYVKMEKKLGQLENQVQTIQRSIAALKMNRSALRKEFGKLNKQIGLLKKEISSVSKPSKVSPTVTEKSPPEAKRRYHEVQRRETLYRIAKQYGLTVDKPRDLNNLSKEKTIYPGQKLLVK